MICTLVPTHSKHHAKRQLSFQDPDPFFCILYVQMVPYHSNSWNTIDLQARRRLRSCTNLNDTFLFYKRKMHSKMFFEISRLCHGIFCSLQWWSGEECEFCWSKGKQPLLWSSYIKKMSWHFTWPISSWNWNEINQFNSKRFYPLLHCCYIFLFLMMKRANKVGIVISSKNLGSPKTDKLLVEVIKQVTVNS